MSEMTRVRGAAPKPPDFTTRQTVDVDVDVDIDAADLEEAGWVYVGKGGGNDNEVADVRAIDAVRDWHDAEHPEPWRFCSQAPCCRLNRD